MVNEPWAVTAARHIFLGGACRCDETGACAVHLDIAEEMQAQREMGVRIGRREREEEIVAWLRMDGPGSPADTYGQAIGGNKWTHAANEIKRGAGRMEDK